MKKELDNIRKRLDKNNDGLVTLDEYLAEEESKGPKEKPGRINYYYQHFDNIISYFKIVMRSFTKFSILCIPNFIIRYGDFVDKTAIVIDVPQKSIIYGTRMKQAIDKCINENSARFIFFSIILRFGKFNHANMCVIDLEKRTLERFEPHGASFYFGKMKDYKDNEEVNILMKKVVLDDLDLRDFKYISPEKISPFIGVQGKADAYCGMCVTISMMYLHLRILNPDIPQKGLIKFLMKRSKEKLKEMILKYAKHVEEKLKENEDYVLDLFNEVIEELNL